MARLTHLDGKGNARMVDISEKRDTKREAIAGGKVKLSPTTYDLVQKGYGPKGDIFTVAKIAGIMAAKRTYDVIPLCHPLSITHIDVDYTFYDKKHVVEITSTVKTKGQTGVEMEALTCTMVVALTIYDMCKAVDKGIELGPFYLVEKRGGKSGKYVRQSTGSKEHGA